MTALPQTKKRLALGAVAEAFSPNDLAEARAQLAKHDGAEVMLSGTVAKKMTRHEHLKLFIKPNEGKLMVFAEFSDEGEAEKIKQAKIRKGSGVSLTGRFSSAGYFAVCLTACRFRGKVKKS